MITIPDRLLCERFVTVFHRSNSTVMLKKQFSQSLFERHSYVSRHVFTLVTVGEQRIRAYDGETLTLRAGEMGIIRRGLYTVTDLVAEHSDFTAFLLFFDDKRLSQFATITDQYSEASLPFYQFKPPAYLSAFWQSIEELHVSLPNHPLLSDIKIEEFFAVLRANETGKLLAEQLSSWRATPLRNLRDFMEMHYDKPLTIQDYAYLTGRSESTFRREFKARFGTTPRQWIIGKRLEKAHHLLETTNWEVAQIAEQIGYDNISHFISAFRRKYQRTPRQKSSLI